MSSVITGNKELYCVAYWAWLKGESPDKPNPSSFELDYIDVISLERQILSEYRSKTAKTEE